MEKHKNKLSILVLLLIILQSSCFSRGETRFKAPGFSLTHLMGKDIQVFPPSEISVENRALMTWADVESSFKEKYPTTDDFRKASMVRLVEALNRNGYFGEALPGIGDTAVLSGDDENAKKRLLASAAARYALFARSFYMWTTWSGIGQNQSIVVVCRMDFEVWNAKHATKLYEYSSYGRETALLGITTSAMDDAIEEAMQGFVTHLTMRERKPKSIRGRN